MVFNVVARNQDDHVKNIAFLMDRAGAWQLSPAFDVTYAYNPAAGWTRRHQMSLAILDEVIEAVSGWPRFAADEDVPKREAERIAKTHRLGLAK